MEIVLAIDRINHQSRQWMGKIGDVEVLRDDSGIRNLTLVEAVTKAMSP